MSSREEQGRQKTPEGGFPREEAVNPPGPAGAPSSSPTQNAEQPDRERYESMEQVVERENMLQALHRVQQNKGAPGVDGMSAEVLTPFLKEHWQGIREELLNDVYKPKPVRRVEIPKPDGGVRLLGIPTVLDRLIQQALLQVLTPIFDSGFSEHSYGFRPGRSAHQAVKEAQKYIEEGYGYAVDIDLEKFFDRVNHDMLMARVARKVKDKRVLRLIRRYLQAGVMVDGVCIETEEGTPQGGPLSPLLANIMLDDLDKELEKRGHRFARYADDCNIYVKTPRAGERVMASVREFVEKKLKLKVNEKKSKVDRPQKLKFLGLTFTWDKKPRIRIAPKALERFEERIRELTERSKGISMDRRLGELNTYLRGWIGYFRLADTASVIQHLDEWIRRRLRMCLLKQWKKPKTKCRNLVALGIYPEEARKLAGSRKGYWRLSDTPQVNKALGLAYWQNQGLISLVDRYRQLHLA